MGSALVFVLWPIRAVRGNASSTGLTAPTPAFQAIMLPPPERMAGVRSVLLRHAEGHAVSILDWGDRTEIWDMASQRSLGSTLPLEWARAAARRDFSGPYDETAVYLFPRSGPGRLVAGAGASPLPASQDYAGPRPVYAFHLRPGATRLYVDALEGEVRARRNGIWRAYDLAFRLHSFEFAQDSAKRMVLTAVLGLWLILGATGLLMATRRWRRG